MASASFERSSVPARDAAADVVVVGARAGQELTHAAAEIKGYLKRRGGGKIVTIGSMTSIFGFDVAMVYASTKGAVVQLTRSLASAWASDNIQVNSILPGWIDTDLTRRARQVVPVLNDNVLARTPAKRWGEPADLAGTAVFFCSPASDFVTGTALPVDGGFSSSMF